MVVDALFLLDEVVGVAILRTGAVVVSGISARRELNLRNIIPLHQREDDSDNGTYRNENLSPEIWKNGNTHGERITNTHRETNPTKRRIKGRRKRGFGGGWWQSE